MNVKYNTEDFVSLTVFMEDKYIFFMHSTFHKTRKLNFGRNLTIDEIMDACDLFKTSVWVSNT